MSAPILRSRSTLFQRRLHRQIADGTLTNPKGTNGKTRDQQAERRTGRDHGDVQLMSDGADTRIEIVVSEADYIATIARAYMASPDGTDEQAYLEKALDAACERVGDDPDAVLERLTAVVSIIREAEVGGG